MPLKALRPCPRCGTLTRTRLCPTHEKANRQRIDKARGTAAARGYDGRHRKWRTMVLHRNPLCADPSKRHPGETIHATVADHVVPLSRGGSWSLSNGQGLCASCHGYKNATEDGAWQQ